MTIYICDQQTNQSINKSMSLTLEAAAEAAAVLISVMTSPSNIYNDKIYNSNLVCISLSIIVLNTRRCISNRFYRTGTLQNHQKND